MKTPKHPAGLPLRWRNWLALALTLFGTTAMLGDLIGSRVMKGLGAISMTAPFPKVFCRTDGVEPFAAEFSIVIETADGRRENHAVIPEVYARLAGPYNRRNVYGAAMAGGPILPPPMWDSVLSHGLGPGGPLRTEFGLPKNTTNLFVVVRSKTRGRDQTWVLRPTPNE